MNYEVIKVHDQCDADTISMSFPKCYVQVIVFEFASFGHPNQESPENFEDRNLRTGGHPLFPSPTKAVLGHCITSLSHRISIADMLNQHRAIFHRNNQIT